MSGRITIDEQDDVYVRHARRVYVEESVEVVVRACNGVTLDSSRVDVWTNNDFRHGGTGNIFHDRPISS